MAWGKAKEVSTFSKVAPLVILLVVIGGAAFVGYHIYLGVQQIRDSASQRMERKNVVWTEDGLKVGVKSIKNEKYIDQTQSWVVKAWNLAQPGSSDGADKKKE